MSVVRAHVHVPLPLADSFLVLMILAANSCPEDFFTHLRTTEKAPLRGGNKGLRGAAHASGGGGGQHRLQGAPLGDEGAPPSRHAVDSHLAQALPRPFQGLFYVYAELQLLLLPALSLSRK